MSSPTSTSTSSQVQVDCIIYDWLTFSTKDYSLDGILQLLGLDGVQWQQGLGSKLRYSERWSFMGMSIHWTPDNVTDRNEGVCVEFSGQGCRAFETFGGISFENLLSWCVECGCSITRLDVALDDFSGLIDIQEMFDKANRFEFTCRTQHIQCYSDCPDQLPDHRALTICHGSRSSNVFIRCYDKRCERQAYDDYSHWVRLELQLRGENALGFVLASGSIGDRFRGVLANYLNYVDPVQEDSNKRRWPVSSWWVNLLDGAAAISIASKKDIEYNKLRLDTYVYGQCINAVKAELMYDGGEKFLRTVFSESPGMPIKYSVIEKNNGITPSDPRAYFRSLGLEV